MKDNKDIFNLRAVKYRRVAYPNATVIAFNPQYQKNINKNCLIQFPVIETHQHKRQKERQTSNFFNNNIDKKVIEDQILRKTNDKTVKSLIKAYDQSRKKKSEMHMNMLGLDVIKIKCINQQKKVQNKREESFKKMNKLSQKMSYLNFQQQYSDRSTGRKTTETHDNSQSQLIKLQMTDSFMLYAKRSSTDSISPNKIRRISNNQFTTVSPPKKAKQYLYKKLQGTQNKKNQQMSQVYQKRIKSYLDLIWKVQFAHNIYCNLDIKLDDLGNRPKKMKAYVGPGNNSAMIKGLLKRRFWWVISQQRTIDCQFVWTQIKINQIFQNQKKSLKKKPKYHSAQQQEVIKLTSVQSGLKKRRSITSPIKKSKQQQQLQTNQIYNSKILHEQDLICYKKYYNQYNVSDKQRTYEHRSSKTLKQLSLHTVNTSQFSTITIHNHLQNNFYLGNKKALFHNLKEYYSLIKEDPFNYVPFTFHIKNGFKDPQYARFLEYHKKRNKIIKKQEKQIQDGDRTKRKTRNIWIVKPGENSNQGRGITVIDEVYQLNSIMKQTLNAQKNQNALTNSQKNKLNQKQENQAKNTFIVQMYLDRPFLYNNRKFDIRHYMLITNFFGIMRAYWYDEGYIRTSSYQFNVDNFEPQIHLTNDFIQKNYPEYGKYQPYNKLSYEEFQRYLDMNFSQKKYNFRSSILPQMKKMATDAAKSVFTKISPGNQINNFEIYGLDFMIDKNFRPWLIEINTNPCLDCQCPLLDRIIPYMVEQSFKLSLDICYPPPSHYPNTCRHFAPLINLQTFKYELIFDSQVEGDQLINLYRRVKGNLINDIGQIDDDQTFMDDGKEIKLDDFT